MDSSSHGSACFYTQANALVRKNMTFQKRNLKTNIRIVAFPVFLCVVLAILQTVINDELNKPKYRCGCQCIDTNGNGPCENVCGVQYSTLDQVSSCPIPSPPEWPALLQVPRPEFRAAKTDFIPFEDLPYISCRERQSCPATILFTGTNQSLGDSVASNMVTRVSTSNLSDHLSTLANAILGTDTMTGLQQFIEPAFLSDRPIYTLQPQCISNSSMSFPFNLETTTIQEDLKCVQGLNLWRDTSSIINDELFKGYRKGNTMGLINEIMAAYDLSNSNANNFNVSIWYNSTFENASIWGIPPGLVRVARSVNVVSNAYLQMLMGAGVKMQIEFTKEMPKPATRLTLDFSSLLGPLFFKWVIELLLPLNECTRKKTVWFLLEMVHLLWAYGIILSANSGRWQVILTYLVYEKQHKLRIMMKMHGLGDRAYWTISYAYFLVISTIYVVFLVVFSSLIGLKFFTMNDYSIQFVFFFSYINLLVVLAFLLATIFSNVKIALAVTYLYIFGSGFLAGYLLRAFVEDTSFPKPWIVVMEIVPAFSLYRGLYELGQYSFNGAYMGTSGMRWGDLGDGTNGMREVLIIIVVEWLVLLPVAYYMDQVSLLGGRIRQHPLFFLQYFWRKTLLPNQTLNLSHQKSEVFIDMEKPDIVQEREVVEQLLLQPTASYAIVCNNLKKVYPGRDGNPDKFAVQGISLALPRGECFGILGQNGAGKTSFINMMIGLTTPTSGDAYVEGFNIQTDMEKIYASMGVCPQHDMLWEMLTGREHLLFYGRLKNLKGSALTQSIDESLKSVNLFYGGVGDKQVGKYSGGMKRRLSVAISLMGDPKVVYMDEPSTGLDPASRNNLWNVVKNAKQNRAIILTTHSMEEAEVLCDRLGIFADGRLQCIGNPKQLKARYGGSYVFTMTTSPDEEQEVESLVRQLSPNAKKIYLLSGTQKFEIPKQDIKIADVFQAVENAKSKFTIKAWGLVDTTLEDVFIKIAKGTDSSSA